MTSTSKRRASPARRSGLHGLVFAVAMLSIALNGANAHAARQSVQGTHLASAAQKFDNASRYAAVFRLRPPRRLMSRHLELAAVGMSANENMNARFAITPHGDSEWPSTAEK